MDTDLRLPAAAESDRVRLLLAFGALYVIWGSTYLGIRVALEGGFPPLLLAGLRFIAAGGGMYLVLRSRGVPAPPPVQWRSALYIGTLLVCANGGVAIAEQWVSSNVAAIAIGSVPLWAALIAGFFGRWPRRVEWVGLAIGFLGVALLQGRGELRANPAGAMVLTLSCASWALGSMWSRRLPLPAGLMSSAAQMLAGGAVALVAGLLFGERFTRVPSAGALAAFAYLAVFGSIVAYSAYQFLLARVRPALATSYAYVNPVVAVILGVALAGETIAPGAIGALVLILSGVGMLALHRARST